MRILVISNYYPPFELGGWEQLTRDAVVQLEKRGHQVYVLTSNYQAAHVTRSEPNIARVFHLESPDHVYYHPHYTLTHLWREGQNRRNLRQAVDWFVPDIIFINGMWNLSHSIAWQAEKLCPGRVVYYMASYWPTELDAHTAYWVAPTIYPWLRRSKQWIGWLARKTLLSDLSNHQLTFARVLCVSAFIQRYVVSEVGVPFSQTCVVHNGIDTNEFRPNESISEVHAPLRLLYAGGLVKHKGVHTTIEAIEYLVHQIGLTNVYLTLIGAGPTHYIQLLKDRIQTLELTRFINFGERVPRNQMSTLLRQYDALLFPSIWPEPLARIMQEAMACGLVVLGTTTGGTPEILHDGKNGLTFEADNAPMLANKIAQIAHNPTLRLELAQAARETVEKYFTFERMIDEIENNFDQVITGTA